MYLRSLFGLVITARGKLSIPSRTRPIRPVAPMVLRLKTWESRSSPNLIRNAKRSRYDFSLNSIELEAHCAKRNTVAGWSSPVARQAHNLKVVGSNPTPATKKLRQIKCLEPDLISRALCVFSMSTPCQRLASRTPRKAVIVGNHQILLTIEDDWQILRLTQVL